MIALWLQKWRRIKPHLLGRLFSLLHASHNVRIGRRFQVDTFPDLIIDPAATLEIGDNVVFRRNVELRVHKESRVEIGSNCRIDRGVRILASNKACVRINEGARLGLYTVLSGGDDICIGANALISGFVYLQTSMHRHKAHTMIQHQGYDHAPVTLGPDSWLGAHVVVLPGCEVGEGAVVGSNAVVTGSVLPGVIAAGVPARPMRSRNEDS